MLQFKFQVTKIVIVRHILPQNDLNDIEQCSD